MNIEDLKKFNAKYNQIRELEEKLEKAKKVLEYYEEKAERLPKERKVKLDYRKTNDSVFQTVDVPIESLIRFSREDYYRLQSEHSKALTEFKAL